jgi:hypothetical protein
MLAGRLLLAEVLLPTQLRILKVGQVTLILGQLAVQQPEQVGHILIAQFLQEVVQVVLLAVRVVILVTHIHILT